MADIGDIDTKKSFADTYTEILNHGYMYFGGRPITFLPEFLILDMNFSNSIKMPLV